MSGVRACVRACITQGATFMAAGSSAPELFTSVAAVFAPTPGCGEDTESVGVSTIRRMAALRPLGHFGATSTPLSPSTTSSGIARQRVEIFAGAQRFPQRLAPPPAALAVDEDEQRGPLAGLSDVGRHHVRGLRDV